MRGRLCGGDASTPDTFVVWEVAGVCARCQVSVRQGIFGDFSGDDMVMLASRSDDVLGDSGPLIRFTL